MIPEKTKREQESKEQAELQRPGITHLVKQKYSMNDIDNINVQEQIDKGVDDRRNLQRKNCQCLKQHGSKGWIDITLCSANSAV